MRDARLGGGCIPTFLVPRAAVAAVQHSHAWQAGRHSFDLVLL